MKINAAENLDALDAKVVEYIRRINLKPKLLGADARDLWTIIANIQKYYNEKMTEQAIGYETKLKQQSAEIQRLRYYLSLSGGGETK